MGSAMVMVAWLFIPGVHKSHLKPFKSSLEFMRDSGRRINLMVSEELSGIMAIIIKDNGLWARGMDKELTTI